MGALPPHVFAIAERAYRHMLSSFRSQSIVCSGDSGAGKTETAKYLLRYLTTIAGSGNGEQSALEKRIIEANPIMEAFGNAKTLRNNNSSRFGKFVRVHFGNDYRVVGADITTYLLEKPRLTLQPRGERNFHIFYQVLHIYNVCHGSCLTYLIEILKGASPSDRDLWNLGNLTALDFHYTKESNCHELAEIDDKNDYLHVRNALTCAGISDDEQRTLLSVVAALLHLGNVTFKSCEKGNTDGSIVTEQGMEWLKKFCALTLCDPTLVERALLNRTMVTRLAQRSIGIFSN